MKKYFAIVTLLFLSACGGGSSGNGILIEGQLLQGAETHHTSALFRHGANEPIGEVTICALGECSITDDAGNWGFAAPGDFQGGDVEFTIVGHGINARTNVALPGSSDAFIVFEHGEGDIVEYELQSSPFHSEEHVGGHDH